MQPYYRTTSPHVIPLKSDIDKKDENKKDDPHWFEDINSTPANSTPAMKLTKWLDKEQPITYIHQLIEIFSKKYCSDPFLSSMTIFSFLQFMVFEATPDSKLSDNQIILGDFLPGFPNKKLLLCMKRILLCDPSEKELNPKIKALFDMPNINEIIDQAFKQFNNVQQSDIIGRRSILLLNPIGEIVSDSDVIATIKINNNEYELQLLSSSSIYSVVSRFIRQGFLQNANCMIKPERLLNLNLFSQKTSEECKKLTFQEILEQHIIQGDIFKESIKQFREKNSSSCCVLPEDLEDIDKLLRAEINMLSQHNSLIGT